MVLVDWTMGEDENNVCVHMWSGVVGRGGGTGGGVDK